MMMMKVVMRTCLGIHLRSDETSRLEPTSTKVVAAPMASALMAEFVTASAGHRPSSWMKTGFSRQSPLTSSRSWMVRDGSAITRAPARRRGVCPAGRRIDPAPFAALMIRPPRWTRSWRR